MRNRHLRSFTLIELLVVVAIIAVLVSMLLPALSAARDRTHEANCMANMRHMGLAAQMYFDEWHGGFFNVGCYNQGWPGEDETSWWYRLMPYSSLREGPTGFPPDWENWPAGRGWMCPKTGVMFSYNHWYYWSGKVLDKIAEPSRKPLFAEFSYRTFTSWYPDGAPAEYHFLNPHREGGHFFFLDFHVAWIPPKAYYYRMNDEHFHWATEDQW